MLLIIKKESQQLPWFAEDNGKVYISRMNSGLMASAMTGIIPEVMDDAAKENEEILDAVIKK